ncbi:uncharacterized protein LOC135397806 isoform X2 [Ornithodoros turicata]|uniref:uncharacterized protein LOC135397806 isoform X2 n=1 Tax=Ornithodoros turicata TaxID=34597 RepID=UPI003138ABB6
MKLLLCCGGRKAVVSGDSIATVENAIGPAAAALSIPEEELRRNHLMIYDGDFDTYEETALSALVKDKDRIVFEDGESEGIVVQDIVNLAAVPRTSKPRTDDCVFPPVPVDIQKATANHQRGNIFEARSRVVSWLYFDQCNYTRVPEATVLQSRRNRTHFSGFQTSSTKQ